MKELKEYIMEFSNSNTPLCEKRHINNSIEDFSDDIYNISQLVNKEYDKLLNKLQEIWQKKEKLKKDCDVGDDEGNKYFINVLKSMIDKGDQYMKHRVEFEVDNKYWNLNKDLNKDKKCSEIFDKLSKNEFYIKSLELQKEYREIENTKNFTINYKSTKLEFNNINNNPKLKNTVCRNIGTFLFYCEDIYKLQSYQYHSKQDFILLCYDRDMDGAGAFFGNIDNVNYFGLNCNSNNLQNDIFHEMQHFFDTNLYIKKGILKKEMDLGEFNDEFCYKNVSTFQLYSESKSKKCSDDDMFKSARSTFGLFSYLKTNTEKHAHLQAFYRELKQNLSTNPKLVSILQHLNIDNKLDSDVTRFLDVYVSLNEMYKDILKGYGIFDTNKHDDYYNIRVMNKFYESIEKIFPLLNKKYNYVNKIDNLLNFIKDCIKYMDKEIKRYKQVIKDLQKEYPYTKIKGLELL